MTARSRVRRRPRGRLVAPRNRALRRTREASTKCAGHESARSSALSAFGSTAERGRIPFIFDELRCGPNTSFTFSSAHVIKAPRSPRTRLDHKVRSTKNRNDPRRARTEASRGFDSRPSWTMSSPPPMPPPNPRRSVTLPARSHLAPSSVSAFSGSFVAALEKGPVFLRERGGPGFRK
jgi:hypothetical protein